MSVTPPVYIVTPQIICIIVVLKVLKRGFWDKIFWPSKPRTTEEPRIVESHIKVDIWRKILLQRPGLFSGLNH